ncbi:MAG: hypothetical protein ACRDOK_12790 [Streptosporangiaceae bacterium]
MVGAGSDVGWSLPGLEPVDGDVSGLPGIGTIMAVRTQADPGSGSTEQPNQDAYAGAGGREPPTGVGLDVDKPPDGGGPAGSDHVNHFVHPNSNGRPR